MLSRLSRISRHISLPLTPSRHALLFTRLGSTSAIRTAAKPRTRKKRVQEVVQLEDLPAFKVDLAGQRLEPMEPYVETKGGRPQTSSATSDPAEEAQYQAALQAGDVPDTALAKQVYLNWKRFPDCIVLTRVGKFYESYFAPAIHLSSLLNLKLANRRYANGNWPFSGFPTTQLDKYLKILVQDLGHTVVLVEEFDKVKGEEEEAKATDELKPRRVGRVVTPGTLVDETWLNGDESRYLLAIAVGDVTPQATSSGAAPLPISLAYTDASTGEFYSKDTDLDQMEDELARVAPREIVLDSAFKPVWETATSGPLENLFHLLRVQGVHISFADPVQPPILEGLTPFPSAKPSEPTSLEATAIAILRHHLQFALRDSMPGLPMEPNRQTSSAYMQIDASTLQALEIRHAIRPGGNLSLAEQTGFGRNSSLLSVRGTLLSVLSKTVTPSGHRLLIRTLTAPSTSIKSINARLSLVQAVADRTDMRVDLRTALKGLGDVMRLMQKFKSKRGDGRDVWEVARWIRAMSKIIDRIRYDIKREGGTSKHPPGSGESVEGIDRLEQYLQQFKDITALADKIEASVDENALLRGLQAEEDEETAEGIEAAGDALVAQPASSSRRSSETNREAKERERIERENLMWWIKPSFSIELQRLHDNLTALKVDKEKMQAKLRLKTGAEKLTLMKGQRHGYHVQVYKKSDYLKLDKRKGLQAISEGRTLKSYAYSPWSVLGAQTEDATEVLLSAQRKAFEELRQMIIDVSHDIQHNSELVDELDMCMSFAQTAINNNYIRPILTNSTELDIINGRHPSVESSLLTSARSFTPNDTIMTPSSHLHIITGPNQGGKSTLLRQNAIIAILAQSGCFVPADQATIGIVDRVFSRVGARDDLYRDRSTFMLEMVETAGILKHATERSLVIMDEIGRGTTLQAGVSIAYATLDYLLRQIKCRTLFATHYHELAHMLAQWRLDDESSNSGAGVEFWCTDVDEVDGAFSYQYKLKRGINHNSHAIKAARMAGMPDSFLRVAQETLANLQKQSRDS